MDDRLLGIYLNDHLAGAAGGVALSKRMTSSLQDEHARQQLQGIAREIAEDRDSLLGLLRRLELRRVYYKESAGVIGERLGRLKLNGGLVRRSPSSDVVEFEALAMGVTAKRAGWRTLRLLAADDSRLDDGELADLEARAEAQLEALEALRRDAVRRAFVRQAQ